MRSTLFYLAALVLASTTASASNTLQKIPLYYHHQKRSSNSDYVSANARDLENGMLGGTVQIGNPPQNFTFAFDTSTGFSWVRGIQCGTKNCEGREAYDPRNSTTVVSTGQSFTMDYGKGIVHTTLYEDTFRFAGLTVKCMPFGGAYEMKHFDPGFDGYLGLGRNINLNTSGAHYSKRDLTASGFVPNAYQQSNGLSSAQFGMYTTTTTSSGFSDSGSVASALALTNPDGTYSLAKRSRDEPAGYLVIGGVDEDAIKGDLLYIKIDDKNSDSGNWAVPVTSFKFEDDLSFKVSSKAKAIFSSSTDVIGLPNAQAEEFRKRWYAKYDEPDNTFRIPCCLMDQLTSLKVKFGDIKVTVPPEYWSEARTVDTCCEYCHSHIGKSDSDKDYIIGTAFTNAFYTQFDTEKNRVGLGIKKHQDDDGLELCKD